MFHHPPEAILGDGSSGSSAGIALGRMETNLVGHAASVYLDLLDVGQRERPSDFPGRPSKDQSVNVSVATANVLKNQRRKTR